MVGGDKENASEPMELTPPPGESNDSCYTAILLSISALSLLTLRKFSFDWEI